jgi:16S rRNA (uracil1498-N3)-methyltransferase
VPDRVPRVYHAAPLRDGARVALATQAAHHLLRVLRVRCGAPLVIFNGAGGEYAAVLERSTRNTARVRIHRFVPIERESHLPVHLGLAILKAEHMDYAIQKCVELGITRVTPIVTERTLVHLSDRRLDKRQAHWEKVAIAACEQCGRNRLPEFGRSTTFRELVRASAAGTRLVLDSRATQTLGNVPTAHSGVTLLVGPEGGWNESERRSAQRRGFTMAQLGSRILRSETACVAALAVIQTLWGDLPRPSNST